MFARILTCALILSACDPVEVESEPAPEQVEPETQAGGACDVLCLEECYKAEDVGTLLCDGFIEGGAIPAEGRTRCKVQLCAEICSAKFDMCAA